MKRMILAGKIAPEANSGRRAILKGELGKVTVQVEPDQKLSKLIREASKEVVGKWSNSSAR